MANLAHAQYEFSQNGLTYIAIAKIFFCYTFLPSFISFLPFFLKSDAIDEFPTGSRNARASAHFVDRLTLLIA